MRPTKFANRTAVREKPAGDRLIRSIDASQEAGAPGPADQRAVEARRDQRVERRQRHAGVADVVRQTDQDRRHDDGERAYASGADDAATGRASMAPRKNVSR